MRIEFEEGLSEPTLVALKAHWPGLLADPLKPANVSACDDPVFEETWTNASAPAPPKPPLDRPDGQCMREPGAIARRIRSKHGCTTCSKPAATTLGGQLVVCHTLLEVINASCGGLLAHPAHSATPASAPWGSCPSRLGLG